MTQVKKRLIKAANLFLVFLITSLSLFPNTSSANINIGSNLVDIENDIEVDTYAPNPPTTFGDKLLVGWHQYDPIDYSFINSFLTVINKDNTLVSLPFTISPKTDDNSDTILYKGLADGNILVYWYSSSSGTGLKDAYFKIVDQSGNEITPATKINSETGELNRFTEVSQLSNGNLAFVWATGGSNYALRRFAPSGIPIDNEQLSITSLAGVSGSQYSHKIVSNDNGRFMIMLSYYNPNYVGMVFDNDSSTPIKVNGNNSFIISSRGENGNESQYLSLLPNGKFLAVYQKKAGSDTSTRSVAFRIYNNDGTPYMDEKVIRQIHSWGSINEPMITSNGFILSYMYNDLKNPKSYIEEYSSDGVFNSDLELNLPPIVGEYGLVFPFKDVDGNVSFMINDVRTEDRKDYDLWLLRNLNNENSSDALPPSIITQPTDQTVSKDDTVALTVEATSSKGNLSYQWYSNTVNSNTGGTAIVGATNATYPPPTNTVGTTYYYCVVTNTDSSVTGNNTATAISNVVMVTVDAGMPSDIIPPNAGDNGTISTTNVTASGVTLNWSKASDNSTAESDLEYQVYQSDSNNIDTISNIEENGILLGSGFTKDISSFDVTELSPNTTYYFNLIVRDQAGNKSAYMMKGVTTNSEVLDPGVTVTIGNVKIRKGLTGEIPVSINAPSTGIGSYGIQIDYDPAILDVLEIIPNDPDDDGFFSNIPAQENWLKVAWIDFTGGESPITNETELFRIKVKVKDDAELGKMALTVDKDKKVNFNFSNIESEDIPSEVVNGAIEVVNSYHVTFNVNGGNSIDSQLIMENGKAIKPENPTREGFTFSGWYTNDQYTTEFDFNTAVNGDITLYAKWKDEQSSDATLSNLTISPFAFTEPFASDKENYYAAVPYGTEKVTVHATAADPNAAISINHIDSNSQEVTLDSNGSTTISVLVTAANGAIKTYTITVNETAYEVSSNADLSALSFSDQISLTESFDKDKLNYTANVTLPPAGPVTVTAAKSDSKAQVSYKLNDEQSTDTLELNAGKNKVEVIVTAEDGKVKSYTVMITVGLKGDADVDGDVDIFDWQETARFILNKKKPSSQAKWNADINEDNSVGIGDWVLIANMLLN